MRLRKVLVSIILMSVLLLVIGAGSSGGNAKLDMDDHPIYMHSDLSSIQKQLNTNYSSTYDKYNKKRIVFSTTILEKKKNNKEITVSGNYKITSDAKNEIATLSVNDKVVVYGVADIGSEKKKTIAIKADHFVKTTDELAGDYYIYNGKSYTKSNDIKTLGSGHVSYEFPTSGRLVQCDTDTIFNSIIRQNDDGACYLTGNAAVCIFYFDNDVFIKNPDDKTQTRGIERAIISNICPGEKAKLSWKNLNHYTYPAGSSRAPSGLEFDHYTANYNSFRVEYAFTKAPRGLCVVMFVYNSDSTPADDVLFLLNSITVK